MEHNNIKVSVVIPAYNEGQNIAPLYDKLKAALRSLNCGHQIIFIDDGSTDETADRIRQLAGSDNAVSCIRLRRNFGKAMALAVGFQQARGEKVVTMDADLQDDPAEIPRLLEKIDEGWDLVSGWKKVRKDPFEKRLMSKMFNAVVSATSGLKLHDFNCGLKAYRIEVVKTVKVYGELHRFLPLIAFYYGFRVAEVPVAHHPRQFGKSKYGKGRYFAGLFDFVSVNFLMSYQRKPLHLLGKISFFSFFIGTLLVGYVCFMKFIMGGTGNRPTLTAGVFFYGLAVQIFIFGLLAELVTFTGHSNNVRYQDFIKETIPSRQG